MMRLGRKSISWMITLCMAVSLVLAMPLTAFADTAGIDSYVVDTAVDGDTSTPPSTMSGDSGGFGSADAEGRIWVDKTVTESTGGDGSFDVTLSALAQQYVSTMESAAVEGGGETAEATAADVTFILDMSTSMSNSTSGGNNPIDVADPPNANMRRIQAMVLAVNEAIAIIMEANPNNRVAVHWFGGNATNAVHVGTFMPMGVYTLPSNVTDYLVWSSSSINRVSTQSGMMKDGATHTVVTKDTAAYTPTQNGIVYSMQNSLDFIKNGAGKNGTDKRQPFVFLLSDGASTHAYNQWWTVPSSPTSASSYQGRSNVGGTQEINYTLGTADVAASIILAAAYQKDLLEEAYEAYNTNNGYAIDYDFNFYTVGLGSGNAINGATNHAWVGLNPLGLTEKTFYGEGANDFNGPDQASAANTRTYIGTYTGSSHYGSATSGTSKALGDYSQSGNYTYSTFYQYASTRPQLQQAFDQLSEDVKKATSATKVPVFPDDGDDNSEAGGTPTGTAMTFTDKLGKDMTFSGISIVTVDGAGVKKTVAGVLDSGKYTFTGLGSTATYNDSTHTITWNVAAEDMAPHMYLIDNAAADPVTYTTATPIRLVYNVALDAAATIDSDSTYYSNAFSGDPAEAGAGASFRPTLDNPYYYYTSANVGKTLDSIPSSGTGIDTDSSRYFQGALNTTGVYTNVYITAKMVVESNGKLNSNQIGTVMDLDGNDADLKGAGFVAALKETIVASGSGGKFAYKSGIAKDLPADVDKSGSDVIGAAYVSSLSYANNRFSALLGNNGKLDVMAGIAKSAPGAVAANGAMTYKITVTNYTDAQQTGVTVADTLPAGFNGNTVVDTTENGIATFSRNGLALTWSGITIPADDSVELSFTVTAPNSPGTEYKNTATITNIGTKSIASAPATSNETSTTVARSANVTINVKLDDTTWPDAEVTLLPKGGGDAIAKTGFSAVPYADYWIYVNGENSNIGLLVDSSAESATLEYYTLTVLGDEGIRSTEGSGVYLSGTAVTPVKALVKDGYSFDTWATKSGNTVSGAAEPSTSITITATTVVEASTQKAGGPVTINVMLNDAAWTDGQDSVKLVPKDASSNDGKDVTDLSNVPNGIYVIYVGDDNTGQVVEVLNGVMTPGPVTIHYYTVTINCSTGCQDGTGAGTYREGQAVNINTGLADSYAFDCWTTDTCSIGNPSLRQNTFTMPGQQVTLTANAQTGTDMKRYTVEHYVMDTSGAYVKTGDTETRYADAGSQITVSALKNASLEVPGAIAYNSSLDSADGATITSGQVAMPAVDDALTIKLYYDREKFQLTLDMDSSSVTSVNSGVANGWYYYGQEINIEATPKTDYSFECWEADTSQADNVVKQSETITMTPYDLELTAMAILKRSVVDIDVEKEGSGWTGGDSPAITLRPTDGGPDITDLTSVPDGEYIILADGEDTGQTVTVKYDKYKTENEYAKTLQYFRLTLVPLEGIHADTYHTDIYPAGRVINIEAIIESGYTFKNWTEASGTQTASFSTAAVSDYNDIKQHKVDILMPARNLTLEAVASFVGTQVVIEIEKDGNPWADGSQPDITLVAKDGTVIGDLSAVPDGTYKVYADGVDTGQTVTIANGVVTYSSDKLQYYTLTLIAGNGVSSVSGGGAYLAGSKIDISALLEAGYTFTGWSGWDQILSGAQTTITMPAHDLALTAAAVADAETAAGDTTTKSTDGTATGDESQLNLYLLLAIIALACMIGILWYKGKREDAKDI